MVKNTGWGDLECTETAGSDMLLVPGVVPLQALDWIEVSRFRFRGALKVSCGKIGPGSKIR